MRWIRRVKLDKQYIMNISILSGGTLVSQVVPLIATPFLTRIYDPEQFGQFALFASTCAIIGSINTGRLEAALFIERSTAGENTVIMTSLFITIVVTTISAVFLLASKAWFGCFRDLSYAETVVGLALLSLFVLSFGIYKILYNLSIKLRDFGSVAKIRAVKGVSTSSSTLGIGLWAPSSGLILGYLIGELYMSAAMIVKHQLRLNELRRELAIRRIRKGIRRHRGFLTLSTPADGISSLANNIPTILIGSFFGATVVGWYGFTHRLLTAPISMIASSVVDAFKTEASEQYATTGEFTKLFKRTSGLLISLSIIPCIVAFLFADELFAIVFGQKWRVAGEYASILSLLYFIRFVVSPLTYTVNIIERQDVTLVWSVAVLAVSVTSFAFGGVAGSVKVGLWSFSVGYSLLYASYFFYLYHLSKGTRTR